MEFIFVVITTAGFDNILPALIGALIGWTIPQPGFMKPITDVVSKWFGFDRFHEKSDDDDNK